MDERSRVVAVQINRSAHPLSGGHSGALGLAIVLAGLALVIYGAAPEVRFRIWRTNAASALGQIVENVPVVSGAGTTRWSPIVAFHAEGQAVLALVAASTSAESWPLGDPVEVLYDPLDPHGARLAHRRFAVPLSAIAGVGIIAVYLASIG